MADWKDDFDPVGMAKMVNWEIAKGYLRAAVQAGGQVPNGANREPDWDELNVAVEEFIAHVEDNALQE